jgi:hypothetical protein
VGKLSPVEAAEAAIGVYEIRKNSTDIHAEFNSPIRDKFHLPDTSKFVGISGWAFLNSKTGFES